MKYLKILRIKKALSISLLLLAILVSVAGCQKTDYKNEYFKAELDNGILKQKNKELENKVVNLTVENSYYQTEYNYYKSKADEYKLKYDSLFLYALLAQDILEANGINFKMVEGGLDYDALRGEND